MDHEYGVTEDSEKALFDRWRGETVAQTLGTNFGSSLSPIQSWYRFKEAFAPELVSAAIATNPIRVRRCLDPFAGSGTTALVCQMMGVESHSYEVNPFLFDLVSAKVENYDLETLSARVSAFIARVENGVTPPCDVRPWPPTFIEPGKKGRWIFDADVARQLAVVVSSANSEVDLPSRQFLRVAIGAILAPVSNVVINGKGRRYRKGWQQRTGCQPNIVQYLQVQLNKMLGDLRAFQDRFGAKAFVYLKDSREAGSDIPEFDLAVFSPPYPNSFDYTDVYNLELWTLGYLTTREDNRSLRAKTLSSHVQLTRPFQGPPDSSSELASCLSQLEAKRSELWNPHLPEMISSYFAELYDLIHRLSSKKRDGGRIHVVIGDSRYSGVDVHTSTILRELAIGLGAGIVEERPLREMRSSPQQGGQASLKETLLIIE